MVLFAHGIPKGMKMKDFNSRIKVERIYIQLFVGAKANQLNHYVKPMLEEYNYDCLIIHVGISDILGCNDDNEINNLSRIMLELQIPAKMKKLAKYISQLFHYQSTLKMNISQGRKEKEKQL